MIQVFIYAIIAIGFVIWLVIASKNKSKLGINLKRVYCPICKTKQPFIRMPKSGSQALWGGTTCPKCHANLNKYGNVIP
jgi:RNase P subunit RPR2